MFADVFVAMSTQTTADDKTAQLKDATAWLPKQMRLTYKWGQEYFKTNNPEPGWIKEIKAKRAKDEEALEVLGGSQAIAAAFNRIGMRLGNPAPGDPGGLAASKPIEQAKAKKFDPKKRGLDQLPANKWIDDPANFDDGKTNKTRLVGTWVRFPTGSAGRTKTQLHRLCICDQSKDPANKESATYPGHFASTQGGSNTSSAHPPNQGKDGCSFSKFIPDPDKQGSARRRQRQGETRRERRHVERQRDRRRRGPQARHCPQHREPREPGPHARRSARR